jgi:thiosulfate/3-mercaptopyruvate sulfurtransferase
MNEWTTLVSAEDLHAALGREDLVVLDARVSLADRSAGEAMYLEGHIPGARHADLDRDLSDHRKPHAGRHPWPDAPDFCATLRRWGVHVDDQVVVYDAGDGALAASRAWFLLRALGHRKVAVLDGGWARWCALGFPVGTDVPAPQPSDYDARFDESRLLDADAVQAHLRAGGVLLDGRAAERFRGEVEPLDKAAGHVPGATNRPFAMNLRDGRFKPARELADEFAAAIGTHPPRDVAVMCGSGVTACHHLLAMEHAGLLGGRLFTGSWSGWIDDPSRPVASGA